MAQFLFVNNIFKAVAIMLLASFACEDDIYPDPDSSDTIEEFENRLDDLRKGADIPGMVAGIVKDGNVIWTKNYGLADVSQQKLVSDSTIFHLASLTKPIASAVILQLVDEGLIGLNDPVSDYGITLDEKDTVRVIHLLTHTSEGVPGSKYKYNGDRYALLSTVMEFATGKPFHVLAYERIMQPLGLENTAPSNMKLAAMDGMDTIRLKLNTAQGYSSNGKEEVEYPKNFSTAAGLISNINDMLKFAASFEGNLLLTEESKKTIFSPMISNNGKTLPYGLGWFIEQREGIQLNWHYGYWTGISSLIIRVPEQKISFVLMANSDKLSSTFPLDNGEVWVSPYAKEFLQSFVLEGAKLK